MGNLYKLVVRDSNGKVQQIHELYYSLQMFDTVASACEQGYSVTVTQLSK